MPNTILNPFTSKLDFAGLSSSEADLLYIRLDGTSTTTAVIPFTDGIAVESGGKITFRETSSLEVFSFSSTDYDNPTVLTLTAAGGTTPYLELSNCALYATTASRMNVFGVSFTVSGITPADVNDTLVAYNSQSSTSGTIRALQSLALFSGGSNSSGQNFGFNAVAVHKGAGALTRTTAAGGISANRSRVIVDTGGSGAISLATSVSAHLSMTSGVSSTVSEFIGFQAELPTVNVNTLTTYDGVRVRGSALGIPGLGTAYGVRVDEFVVGSTNYQVALDGISTGSGIYFNTPTRAGTEYVRSNTSQELSVAANARVLVLINSTEYLHIDTTESVYNDGGLDVDFRLEGDTLSHMIFTDASAATENIALLATAAPNWQSMDRGIFIGDTTTAPTGDPSSGGFLYSESGALKWRGSSGTITTIGAA